MDFFEKLEQAMIDKGFRYIGNINTFTDKFQRFKAANRPSGGRPLFVKLLSGDGAIFGDWRDRDSWVTIWDKELKELTVEEKYRRNLQIEQFKRDLELQRNHAIYRAKELLLHRCITSPNEHPYVIKKRITPYYAVRLRDWLLIKIHDAERNLVSLQRILPSGKKRFKKGASPKGGMVFIGEKEELRTAEMIWICEGYATGCSIYEAVKTPVVCALSADNLSNVACALKLKYPGANICICADNDAWGAENIGVISAIKAAKNSGTFIRRPNFDNFDTSSRPTDFNDLMCLAGLEEVKRQLLNIKK